MRRRPPEPEPEREPEPEQAAVLVIGAGASGVAAARAAAGGFGRSAAACVVLVGDERPGGASQLVADGGVLLDCATRGLDWHATLAHLDTVRAVVEDRSREAALRADGVDFVPGRGRLERGGIVAIESIDRGAGSRPPQRLRAERIILATGDEHRPPEIAGLADTRHLTATTVLQLTDLPPSLVVLGAGPHGCELAQALVRFGVQVTLVEAAERILPGEHPDAADLVARALRADGVRVLTGSPAVSVAPTLDGGAWVGIGPGGDVAAEGLLLATGRRPAVRRLDLPAAGVALTASGGVRVDVHLRTTAHQVLAVGRVTGLLPHGSIDPVMARAAGLNAAAGYLRTRRPPARWSPAGLPRVVRTVPALAAVGVAPADATLVPGATISALPLGAVDPRPVDGGDSGLVSLVGGPPRAPGGRLRLAGRRQAAPALLGASIVGPQAGELADLVSVALRAGLTIEQLADAPVSSRTSAAALQRAAAGFGAAVPAER